MKKWIAVVALVVLTAPGLAGAGVDDQHLVMFKGSASKLAQKVYDLGGDVVYSHRVGFAVVSGLSDEGASTLAASKKVLDVQPDSTFDLDPIFSGDAVAVGDATASPLDPTTAGRYPWQWNMRAISADAAWAAGRLGSPAVTVAILDTGIDYTYPDLADRVDLSRSISFVPEDDAYVAYYFPDKHPVTDLHYHGTHVAATAVSNGYVTAGITSQTTLIGVKVCSFLGGCEFGSVIAGVLHAADAGADVANMSLGGGFGKAGNGQYVGFINKVFNYANNRGMTIVVSAGNDSLDLDHSPNLYKTYCSTPNTICVSATGPTSSEDFYEGPWTDVDAFAPYSNFGRSAINVAAPGGNDGGFVWAACSQTSLVIPGCQGGTFIVGLAGTSMAAPHVSGLAALVVEDVGRRPGRVKTVIQQGADDLGQRGTDPYYGKGRINVYETAMP